MLNYLKTVEDKSFQLSDLIDRNVAFSSYVHELDLLRASKSVTCKGLEYCTL